MTENLKPLTVFLADDHELVAKGIANLLLSVPPIATVKTFLSGKDLYMACSNTLPHLVLLDVEMPGWNGLETLDKIKENFKVPVIMLTMNDEKAIIEQAFKRGAMGYLHKNCSLHELQQAVQSVFRNEIFMSEETKKIMVGLNTISSEPKFELAEPLTDKEYEVLKYVCDGLSSKEIGDKLFISPRTVETRKNNLMQKFNVQSTGRLIALAIKNKIVT